MITFPILADIIPEQEYEGHSFEHINVDGYNRLYLKCGNDVIMYDMFQRPLKDIYSLNMDEFKGEVLIAGAGVGFCIFPIKDNPEITSITVIENNQFVIDMLSPFLPGVTFIKDDALTYIPTQNYDTIFLDIWEHSIHDIKHFEERRYSEYLNDGGFINFLEF
jgi:spermidine synthase